MSVLRVLLAVPLVAYGAVDSTAELKKLSVEELMDIEVTSVSKTSETLGGAAAAVAVVTAEDIRRSGATTIPESLRGVPGLYVGRQNSSDWAVASRGFASVNSEKLLVLTDTRSIYTPLFSGVSWDVQNYLMEDIDRIEIIRGPGAALWGSNAVNGVINITTKRAQDTQGVHLEAGGGTFERALAGARYGGEFSDGVYYRVFGQFFDRDASYAPGVDSEDDWHAGHFGFRADWKKTEADAFTVQGDVYRGTVGQLAPSASIIGRPGPQGQLRADVSGGNLLGRWQHEVSADSEIQLRAYYDRTQRDDPSFNDELDTVDLDLQHRFSLSRRHEMLYGLNYRYTANRNEGKGIFAVEPHTSRDQLASAFVQDQISISDTLRVTLGTKLEHNDFSGYEVQPSGRVAWEFSPGHTLWSAVSRAVRVPTRLERDIAIDVSDPAANPVVRLSGNEDFDSEKLVAYELGYRWQALSNLSIDVATFYNRYRGLTSLELGTPFVDPRDGKTVIPIVNQNETDGLARGVETLVAFSPLPSWRLTATHSFLSLSLDPHGFDLNRGKFIEGSTPRHQLALQSFIDLPNGWQIDGRIRKLSAIRSIPDIVSGEGLPGYTELDLQLTWQSAQHFRVSLIGQNLLHRRHLEFGNPATSGEVERGVYGKVVWDW